MVLINFIIIFKPPSPNNLSTSAGTSSSHNSRDFSLSLISATARRFNLFITRFPIHVQTYIKSQCVPTKFQGTAIQSTSCIMNLDYVVSVLMLSAVWSLRYYRHFQTWWEIYNSYLLFSYTHLVMRAFKIISKWYCSQEQLTQMREEYERLQQRMKESMKRPTPFERIRNLFRGKSRG